MNPYAIPKPVIGSFDEGARTSNVPLSSSRRQQPVSAASGDRRYASINSLDLAPVHFEDRNGRALEPVLKAKH
ncbi:MAG: hypothetical protein H6960_11460 [Chromatiaceae bacterium]|nr:hypothetical protein [Chromatiaceae bacterium]